MRIDEHIHRHDHPRNGRGLGSLYVNCVRFERQSNGADISPPDNLRYAFSTCVYGFPSVVTNQTSQCPVACAGVEAAVQLGLMNPSAENFRNWCSSTTFADNVISTCEFCYNLTSEAVNPGTTGAQVYLANCAYTPIPDIST